MRRESVGSWCVLVVALSAVVGLLVAPPAGAQAGTVQSEQKISETTGGFGGVLDPNDRFGYGVASLGDLDGDGKRDLAVGSGTQTVWILFLDTDGTVQSEQSISGLGRSVASLGDLDGDGVVDLAVGADIDDDGGPDRGAVRILFLNTDGTVKSQKKISDTTGGFGGALDNGDHFGTSVSSLGDLDGDGIVDLAVGAQEDDDGGTNRGAVWILFLNTDGTVQSEQKISETTGGFTGGFQDSELFGCSVAGLGDLDGDGIEDLAVGAYNNDDGGASQGSVWVLFLDTDGTVKSDQKISETTGGFTGVLDVIDWFGTSVASLGDLNGDGIGDLAVGATGDDDGGSQQGSVWILFLNTDGTVQSHKKISETTGGFTGVLNPSDSFGWSVSSLDDQDGDGIQDLAVGAWLDDDGGSNQGAVWVLFLQNDNVAPMIACPGSLTEECTSPGGAVVTFSVTATDDHDPDPAVVCVPASGSTFPMGPTTVTCTATDLSQNSSMCMFDVTVEDTTPPAIMCPGDMTVYFGRFAPVSGGPATAVSFSVGATDLCDPSLSVVCVPPSGSVFDWGTTTVTCTAEDADGNMSMCMFDVTVTPRVPTLSGPPGGSVVPGSAAPGGVGWTKPEAVEPPPPPEPPRVTPPRMRAFERLNIGAELRSGSSDTPVQLVSANQPRLGQEWRVLVDVSGHPGAWASVVMVTDHPLAGRAFPFGELLVDVGSLNPLAMSVVRSTGGADVHSIRLGSNQELVGRRLCAQALILDERGVLTNAIDIVPRR